MMNDERNMPAPAEAVTDKHHTYGLLAIWVGVLLPLVVCAAEMQTNYVLVRQACAAQHRTGLYAVVIVALAIIILSGATSVVIWKRSGSQWPTDVANVITRVRFISVLGMMMSALAFAVVLAHGIATIRFDPCQL